MSAMLATAELFLVFFKIGLCSIGGGYAVIGMIREQAVERYGWFGEQAFTDMIAISQMTPGPLAVNISTFAGLQQNGISGAVAATAGCVAGGAVISVILYRFFRKYGKSARIAQVLQGLKAASVGLIGSAAASILVMTFAQTSEAAQRQAADWYMVLLLAGALYLLKMKKWNPILVMLLTGAGGLLFY